MDYRHSLSNIKRKEQLEVFPSLKHLALYKCKWYYKGKWLIMQIRYLRALKGHLPVLKSWMYLLQARNRKKKENCKIEQHQTQSINYICEHPSLENQKNLKIAFVSRPILNTLEACFRHFCGLWARPCSSLGFRFLYAY